MFEGTHTALITPFTNGNRNVDESALRALVEKQIAGGIAGVVPVGTTGESPTLSHEEHQRVIEITIEAANKRCLVTAGTGSNSTREAVALTVAAEKAGADAALLVTPYYNKPSQEGLFQHYKAIAEATSLPIVLYSIPGRCGIEIGVDTAARLHEAFPHICAMKEAGGTPERVSQFKANLPDTFEVVSGDDSLTIPFMSVGAVGVISVAGNLIPQAMTELTKAALEGRWPDAIAIHEKYYPLFSGFLKLDTNPVPIKAAMHLAGACEPDLRLPMIPLTDDKTAQLKATLQELNLI
ncbi:MAG: 4-hydroxy-tetrahydrodipicolinate synthase [Verrucomicrobiales bacterium]|jgi:4-hydroxy-tetrahydrodipicolinate synthase